MAPTRPISLRLTAKINAARRVIWLLTPLVAIGLVSSERAAAIAMRFVRVEILPEGWAD